MSTQPKNVEDEIRRLILEIRLLESTAEQLQARMNIINAALVEHSLASMALEGIENKSSDHIFVPIGGGSYIKARLEDTDKVVYGIGAGVAIEKPLREAKEDLANRIAELNKAKAALEQQLSQVLARIQEGQSRLQELAPLLKRDEMKK
ncbi:MAG: prefoldin subunit alpha [Candidatus Bathyarchaeia archaeon]|nr:prefoldin subunit alpha [Candidatus Bathyarchaeota archaeon]